MSVKVTTPYRSRGYTRLLLGDQRTHFCRPCSHPHFRWTGFHLFNRYHRDRKSCARLLASLSVSHRKCFLPICMHFPLSPISHDQLSFFPRDSFSSSHYRLLSGHFKEMSNSWLTGYVRLLILLLASIITIRLITFSIIIVVFISSHFSFWNIIQVIIHLTGSRGLYHSAIFSSQFFIFFKVFVCTKSAFTHNM